MSALHPSGDDSALPGLRLVWPAVGTPHPSGVSSTSISDDLPRDPLTGLYARSVIVDDLASALCPDGPLDLAVLLLDLDGFRAVNRNLGYAVGDRLLVAIASRLVNAICPGDTLVRFGADEFALLAPGRSVAEAWALAEFLQSVVQAPLEVGPALLHPRAAVGVVTREARHTCPEQLLGDAERALARARGRADGLARFDGASEARVGILPQLEAALRRTLDDEDFTAAYQPTLAQKRGQVAGFEILLWKRSPRSTV
jgi:diguanylate cyclase (GGDEF)-like protein